MARVKRGVTSHAKHKKVLSKSKVSLVEEKIQFELPNKLWRKPCNMLIEIEEQKKENLDHYGFKE